MPIIVAWHCTKKQQNSRLSLGSRRTRHFFFRKLRADHSCREALWGKNRNSSHRRSGSDTSVWNDSLMRRKMFVCHFASQRFKAQILSNDKKTRVRCTSGMKSLILFFSLCAFTICFFLLIQFYVISTHEEVFADRDSLTRRSSRKSSAESSPRKLHQYQQTWRHRFLREWNSLDALHFSCVRHNLLLSLRFLDEYTKSVFSFFANVAERWRYCRCRKKLFLCCFFLLWVKDLFVNQKNHLGASNQVKIFSCHKSSEEEKKVKKSRGLSIVLLTSSASTRHLTFEFWLFPQKSCTPLINRRRRREQGTVKKASQEGLWKFTQSACIALIFSFLLGALRQLLRKKSAKIKFLTLHNPPRRLHMKTRACCRNCTCAMKNYTNSLGQS